MKVKDLKTVMNLLLDNGFRPLRSAQWEDMDGNSVTNDMLRRCGLEPKFGDTFPPYCLEIDESDRLYEAGENLRKHIEKESFKVLKNAPAKIPWDDEKPLFKKGESDVL